MKFCEKLILLRKRKGMTQEEFSRAVGVSRQSVYKWESGQSYPEAGKLLEIKKLYSVSIDSLLDDAIPFDEIEQNDIIKVTDQAPKIEYTKSKEKKEDISFTESSKPIKEKSIDIGETVAAETKAPKTETVRPIENKEHQQIGYKEGMQQTKPHTAIVNPDHKKKKKQPGIFEIARSMIFGKRR